MSDFFSVLEKEKSRPRARVHSLHRYYGKLVPAIPRAAIQAYSGPGRVIGDPFCGSGTTLVEARLLGNPGWGIDLNPLAVKIARAKTQDLEPGQLLSGLDQIAASVYHGPAPVPFCVNLEHWFRPEVVPLLARLKAAVDQVNPLEARNFFQVCFSAVLREASNADPRHVFPGYSRRMRALDAAGRDIDPVKAFLDGTARRIRDYTRYRAEWPCTGQATVTVGDACQGQLPRCQLMVTNPPYLGAIRYLETMKLEMYWLSLVTSPQEYLALDRRFLASERWYRREYGRWEESGHPEVDRVTRQIFEAGHGKMSLVVARYFAGVRRFLLSASASVESGGILVVKISDTYIRTQTVPTHRLWCELACGAGFQLLECRPDGYRSRSLLTSRNTYSRMIPHDYLLVFQRA
ncbi:MAG: DNA methyltransferase [Bacillota bacterium]